ncbi:MAG: hypothetical protein M3323_09825 [Actinomycetota bacterium]|nr:hypothetical protein [Actinomycetota bacterium]
MTDADLVAQEGMERRRFLKAAGTIAWATPAILTLTANRAGAQSCVPHNAPCDACAGVNCCIQTGDSLPCCCSNPATPDCGGVCRTQAACAALFPGGPSSDPDACFYPGGTGTTAASSTSRTRSLRTGKSK